MAAEIDGVSKSLLGAFTIFTLGSGLASLVCGTILFTQNMDLNHNAGNINLFIASIVFIIIGGLLIITVLLGVFGALKDVSTLRLITLALLLILLVVLGVVGGWCMFSLKAGHLERSIDLEIKQLKDNKVDHKKGNEKKIEHLNKMYNCSIEYFSNKTTEESESSSSKNSQLIENTPEAKDSCSTTYFQTKSKYVFSVAVVALASVGAVFLALLLYVLVYQRARAEYAAVPRG